MFRAATQPPVTFVASPASAQESARQVLCTSVIIHTELDEQFPEESSVIAMGHPIDSVSLEKTDAPIAFTIDHDRRTLLPSAVNMRWHLCPCKRISEFRMEHDQVAACVDTPRVSFEYQERRYTTACDGRRHRRRIAKILDEEGIHNPCVCANGAFLNQTDTESFNHRFGDHDDLERHAFVYVGDAVTEDRQIKIMADVGVASQIEPIHATQGFDYNTDAIAEIPPDDRVCFLVSAFHDTSANPAVVAEVRMIKHTSLVSEDTVICISEEGITPARQAVMSLDTSDDPASIAFFSADQKGNARKVNEGASVLGRTGGMNPCKHGTRGKTVEGGNADCTRGDGIPLQDRSAVLCGKVDFVMKNIVVYKKGLPDENASAFLPLGPKPAAFFGNPRQT